MLGSSKRWLFPVLLLASLAISVVGVLYTIDLALSHGGSPLGFFDFAHDHITDAVGSLAGVIAAVLGIVITVVSIIVQLSAERYTQVTEMFYRDRTNLAVLGFYVVGCVAGTFVAFSVKGDFVPRVTITFMIVVAAVGFALMAPYFTYVFSFLQPANIIARIRRHALAAAGVGAREAGEERRAESQATALFDLEQLTDITINSIDGKDKIIAVAGVDALKDFTVAYLGEKQVQRAEWFRLGAIVRANPDFVSMAPESVDELEQRRTWVEWKVLRQYQAIYAEALAAMRDLAYVIGIDTRYIGEAALKTHDHEVLTLAVKFFNTYMRATVNARDVRTAYNLMNQYRQLAEAVLRAGHHDKVVEIAGYMRYYSHVCFGMKLGFVTETVAYDLCALSELAHELSSPVEDRLLDIFLEVDQPIEGEGQETSLRGVRKAQVKLATYYLVKNAEPLARRIFADMQAERPERLGSIRDELSGVVSKDFWEVIDRGTNFDYLPPDRKAVLTQFFSWFTALAGPATTPPKEAQR